MRGCRSCNGGIEPFIDFGRMPLANAFLRESEFAGEYFFHLQAAYCPRCTLVQLVEQPAPERMFNDRYPFFSSSSARMSAHFGRLAEDVIARLPQAADPFVVEIGSNDGTLLRPAASRGIRHLGVEPSASVADAASARGVRTLCAFFDVQVARRILAEHGPADAIIAANALSHVGDPHAVVAGIEALLAHDGIVVIEDPYWADVLSQTAFDQIYDEHASYFTLSSIAHLFAAHGLTLFDAMPVNVHGGSIRYFLGRAGSRPTSDRVETLMRREQSEQAAMPSQLAAFRTRVENTGRALVALLERYQRAGTRVVGYGATSKSTTSLNFFGITPELLPFISDTTPAKHGTYSPGAHIPVRPRDAFANPYPERALLFLWNHAAEVRANEQAFAQAGGRWIVYVPSVQEF
jgi:methylation protein EvaC